MQGFNMGRYIPPDLEGTQTTGNKLHGKHALGSRASKSKQQQGILTVRFEMPFAVWCATCPKPTIIPQGVRFNAAKKKVGNYYSTSIWSFRFRHTECGGDIEMRTDPKNTAYVVHEGGQKRDTGDHVQREGDMVIMTDAEREALRKNAFASLEKTINDREVLKQATERIDDLLDVSARQWDDPYAQNQRLRRAFRAGRKEREQTAAKTEDLKTKMSLGIDLLPEIESDALRAALVDFGHGQDPDPDGGPDAQTLSSKALSKPLFGKSSAPPKTRSTSALSSRAVPTLKSERQRAKHKGSLVSELLSNTRTLKDPFLLHHQPPSRSVAKKDTAPTKIHGVKRRQDCTGVEQDTRSKNETPQDEGPMQTKNGAAKSTGLVSYDSD